MTLREARNRALAQQKGVVLISGSVRFLSAARAAFKAPLPVMAPISFVPLVGGSRAYLSMARGNGSLALPPEAARSGTVRSVWS
jgi:hypothetical protein